MSGGMRRRRRARRSASALRIASVLVSPVMSAISAANLSTSAFLMLSAKPHSELGCNYTLTVRLHLASVNLCSLPRRLLPALLSRHQLRWPQPADLVSHRVRPVAVVREEMGLAA